MVRSWAPIALASIVLGAAVGGTPSSASASSTGEPVSIRWLADHAAQVIVCDVAAVQSHWTEGRKRIESQVTLDQLDYLKGGPDVPLDTITLTFPGGTVGDTTMRVGGTPDLGVGQRWLIFLQPEYRTYPAAGMEQGIFRIRADADATPRVFACDGRPVTSIDERGVPLSAVPAPSTRSTPVPVGVRGHVRVHAINPTERSAPAHAVAMTLHDFADRIAPTLRASRVYDVSQPVGRYIPTELTPVPLVVAPNGAPRHAPSATPRAADAVPHADAPSASKGEEAPR